jgi:uracil-DNA glycosylase
MRSSIESSGCVVASNEELRRYLEQRLEMGETSIVLESVTAAQVAPLPKRTMTADDADKRASRGLSASSGSSAVTGQPPDATKPTDTSKIPDWRTALKESGARPPSPKADTARTATGVAVSSAQSKQSGSAPVSEADAPLPPLQSLDDVAASVAGCRRCPLYGTATNPVPGEGNPHADFMVVGEAPGATEDETGRPFVGRAGQLLTQILGAIQLKREDVFICNVLKHRPPGNRNPEPGEVRACSPYLIRQIELIQPKVILALGTFSAQTLLDTKISIGKLRGQIHQYHGVPVVVTYHPAALLRNPAWKRPTWEDVQLARRILDSAVPGA